MTTLIDALLYTTCNAMWGNVRTDGQVSPPNGPTNRKK